MVYIGALLVLFIYVCIFSSNNKVFNKLPNVILILIFIIFLDSNFYNFFRFENSLDINLSIFIILVFVLLLTFLGVLRVLGNKSTIIVSEK